MLLRELPITSTQTVQPMPWLLAREKDETHEAHQAAIRALDSEVAQKFVYQGGLLIYVNSSGNWDVVAERLFPKLGVWRSRETKWVIRNQALWSKVESLLPKEDSQYNDEVIIVSK